MIRVSLNNELLYRYRRLNDVTIKDRYFIGDCSDNLARLENSSVYSTLDGYNAYHSVPIYGPDQEKTAFSSPLGTFCFNFMPFGLTGARKGISKGTRMHE